ncbi:MAG TPA: hypothetical protein VEZ11_10080 [Thermoanaerobaculia bacterium]|nr:hypothetical protein [Thermoanaerobaculia bacterium]
MKGLVLSVILPLAAVAALAQGPDAPWRTIETKHFRIHYPAPYEAWTRQAASRLESVRALVADEVGFSPNQITDVLVENPYAEANGMTIPVLDHPRIILFTEPPGPESEIGNYVDWIDLLSVHEITHLVHMLRPSRNPVERLASRVLPLDPIALNTPRWVTEGYATVVEGRITGSGRPNSSIRAAILRSWAANGRLPSYAQLDSDRRFLGMSMAYLMGSAYLEWLEHRAGPDSLRKLWARLTARQRRNFDEAFEGVFGEKPERLYGRFVAEVTARAVAVESGAGLREGELWQEMTRASGDPAVSPDGTKIAYVIRQSKKPAKLVIASTAPQKEEERKYAKRIESMIERDPEDVAPVRAKPLPHKPLRSLIPPDGGDIESPRWTSDGRALLYTHRQPDRDGFLHHDLYLWSLDGGGVRRMTRGADVEDADSLADGRRVVAVRNRFGQSQLVIVELLTGEVRALTEPSVTRLPSHPRVSADGKRIAYAEHRDGVWHLVIREIGGGEEREISIPAGASIAEPEWSRTAPDEVFATLFAGGFIDIHRFHIGSDSTPVALTRTLGGAFESTPAPDGSIYFTALEPDGFVLRHIDATNLAELKPVAVEGSLTPVIPPPAVPPRTIESASLEPARPYGLGHQEIAVLAGGAIAPSVQATEVDLRLGDVAGRFDAVLAGAFGTAFSPRGAAIGAAFRGLPVEIGGQLFTIEQRPSEQPEAPFVSQALDLDQRGVDLHAAWRADFPRARAVIRGGVLGSEFRPAGGGEWHSRDLAFLDLGGGIRQIATAIRAEEQVRIESIHGRTEGSAWNELRVSARAGASLRGWRVAIAYDRAALSGATLPVDLLTLGGIPSTIVPDAAAANRISDPALPAATLIGTRYEGRRAELVLPFFPTTFFWQQHRLGPAGISPHDLALAGLEFQWTTGPIPLIRLPGVTLTAGAARILDDPLKGKTKGWLALRYRP